MVEVVYQTLLDRTVVHETVPNKEDLEIRVIGTQEYVYRRYGKVTKLLGKLLRVKKEGDI